MTNSELIKKHAFHAFNNAEAFELFLQTEYNKHYLTGFKHYKKSLDCIAVAGVLFTMEEYDMDGVELRWGNKKKGQTLSATTSDRYKNGYEDAKVTMYPSYGYRNDISYIQ